MAAPVLSLTTARELLEAKALQEYQANRIPIVVIRQGGRATIDDSYVAVLGDMKSALLAVCTTLLADREQATRVGMNELKRSFASDTTLGVTSVTYQYTYAEGCVETLTIQMFNNRDRNLGDYIQAYMDENRPLA